MTAAASSSKANASSSSSPAKSAPPRPPRTPPRLPSPPRRAGAATPTTAASANRAGGRRPRGAAAAAAAATAAPPAGPMRDFSVKEAEGGAASALTEYRSFLALTLGVLLVAILIYVFVLAGEGVAVEEGEPPPAGARRAAAAGGLRRPGERRSGGRPRGRHAVTDVGELSLAHRRHSRGASLLVTERQSHPINAVDVRGK